MLQAPLPDLGLRILLIFWSHLLTHPTTVVFGEHNIKNTRYHSMLYEYLHITTMYVVIVNES